MFICLCCYKRQRTLNETPPYGDEWDDIIVRISLLIMASRVNFNVIKVHCLGLNMIMALKIAEKALASLGTFSTILRAIIMLNPQKWTLMRY